MSDDQDMIINETSGVEVFEAQQRAEYDIQIATAKKYPRNITRVRYNSLAIVTMSDEVAASCRYSLPRGGKKISGPSVHLARIIAQQYGNLRVDARVKQITPEQVVSEAVCFDLETNYACKVEVRRSIISFDKQSGIKSRFSDDMITVTGNAANAIALRNAIMNVIPKGITQVVYDGAMRKLANDLNDSDKLKIAVKNMLDGLRDNYKVSEERVIKLLDVSAITDITKEHILDLRAMIQAIKDGDTTIEEQFPEPKKKTSSTSQTDKVNKTFNQAPKDNQPGKQSENKSDPATSEDAKIPDQEADKKDKKLF